MPDNATTREAGRIMTICNACRYCEGHCAVFPAMERETTFTQNNIDLLSNLCHQCGACFRHCQYAAPHEFDVNVPEVFEQARLESYARYVWPSFMQPAISSGTRFTVLSLLASIGVFLLAVINQVGLTGLLVPSDNFYQLMPHTTMAGVFLAAAILIVTCWWKTLGAYWRSVSDQAASKVGLEVLLAAIVSAFTLKNLDGGHGDGCYESGEAPAHWKRRYHHLVFYGFLLCFCATLAGTVYHYGLDSPAPYSWLTLPKLLGVTGGIMLLVGCAGLFWASASTDKQLKANDNGYGSSLTLLLFLTSLTGLALPLAKGSGILGLLLAVHLGCVFALFLNFAVGKFTHGFFRFAALLADEQKKSV